MTATPPVPFRIRIGVTGHRHLKNPDLLLAKIREVIDSKIFDLFDKKSRIFIKNLKSTPIFLSLITPLAEGADRLVAKAVLEREGATIEVVLPFHKDDYLEDFEAEDSKREFEDLLSRSRRPITLRTERFSGLGSTEDRAQARKEGYEAVGKYIVNNCDVLIALWDGQSSRGKGGTAEIVEYARGKKRPLIILSTEDFQVRVEIGHGLHSEVIQPVAIFNDFRTSGEESEAEGKQVFDRLFAGPIADAVPASSRKMVMEKLIPFYVKASRIAAHNQKWYRRTSFFAYIFSVGAVAAVAVGILLPAVSTYAFLLETFLLGFIFLLIGIANWHKSQNRWIENRFLAERLRSAMYFAACNIEIPPIRILPHMQTAHRQSDWMVRVFQEIWNGLPSLKGRQMIGCAMLADFVRERWIQDQIVYHQKKSKQAGKMNHYLEIAGILIFLLAIFAALAHLILHPLQPGLVEKAITFLALVLPGAGAAIGGIRTHREYSRIWKRSTNMARVLLDIHDRFADVQKPEVLERLLRETDEVMLQETQDWLMLMRFVELKPSV